MRTLPTVVVFARGRDLLAALDPATTARAPGPIVSFQRLFTAEELLNALAPFR